VASACRRRQLGGVRWPPRPTRPPTPSALRLLPQLTSHSLPPLPTVAAQPSASPPPQSRSRSPELPVPANLAHRKHLRLAPSFASPLHSWCLPPFAVVRLGSPGISHRSSTMPRRSSRLRRAPISAHRFPLFLRAVALTEHREAVTPHPVPPLGWEWLAAEEQRRRSAMCDSELLAEHTRPRQLHRWTRRTL
jgi:hypothetical protein